MTTILAAIPFATPIAVIAVVVAIAALGIIVASRYKRIAPNSIGVFFGRRYTVTVTDADGKPAKIRRGFRVVTGGGSILWPIFEQYQQMSTAAFQVNISEKDVPTKKNVPVVFAGTATCRISPNPDEQANAVQAFLGKHQTEIDECVTSILRGHMRTIVGQLDVEELLRDRTAFNKKVLEESFDEFRKLGIQILTLVLHDVRDGHGYIDALGKQEIAAKLRDAEIQTAEAQRDTTVRVSQAQREAATAEADNAAMTAEAQKNQQVKVATYKAETERQRALAEVAFEIAKADQDKTLAVAQAERDAKTAEANTAVEEKRALLRERELNATTIVEAETERKAMVIRADGKRQAAVVEAEALHEVAQRRAKQVEIEAEGQRAAAIKTGEGESKKITLLADAKAEATRATLTAEADGKKATMLAEADGRRASLLAEAEGEKAGLLATAEGIQRKLLAEADGKKAYLLGEAEGTLKLAEALKMLTEQGKLILILDRLPALMDKGGAAMAGIAGEIFKPLGASMAAVKSVNIVDMGGGNGNGLAKFGGTIPGMVAEVFTKMKAAGIDITPLMNLLKVDPSGLAKMLAPDESSST